MGWNNIDKKHKKKYDRDFVSCEEPGERKYVVDIIMEEFPYFERASIERSVNYSCRTIPSPRDRKIFLECVVDHIGKV